MTEFFLPIKPPTSTHQMKKVTVIKGKPIFYDPPEVVTAKEKLLTALAPHRPEKPYQGPIRLIVKWLYRRNCSEPIYKHTRPDVDNIQKLLLDCMTKLGFWKDDAQVASMVVEKFWVNEFPGIYIKIEEIQT